MHLKNVELYENLESWGLYVKLYGLTVIILSVFLLTSFAF